MDRAALDRYITRGPYDDCGGEPVTYTCSGCGRVLKHEPDGVREWVVLRRCDGKPKVIECVYGAVPSDEGILQIIGEGHRGESYRLGYAPACGTKAGSRDQSYDGEIDPDKASEWRHEPHWFVEPYGYQAAEIRVCAGCGTVNEAMERG